MRSILVPIFRKGRPFSIRCDLAGTSPLFLRCFFSLKTAANLFFFKNLLLPKMTNNGFFSVRSGTNLWWCFCFGPGELWIDRTTFFMGVSFLLWWLTGPMMRTRRRPPCSRWWGDESIRPSRWASGRPFASVAGSLFSFVSGHSFSLSLSLSLFYSLLFFFSIFLRFFLKRRFTFFLRRSSRLGFGFIGAAGKTIESVWVWVFRFFLDSFALCPSTRYSANAKFFDEKKTEKSDRVALFFNQSK